jgi:hypothetical protein
LRLTLLFAQVADVDDFGFWMQHYRTVVTGFDAPSAAVALVHVHHYRACFLRLRQRVTWASSNAWWVFAAPAGNRHVRQLIHADHAYAGFQRVEGFFLRP